MNDHLEVTKSPASDPYYDLGSFGRTVSTTNNDARIWFNRGFTWAYSFNHEEAMTCFEQTIAHDPRCAMGYWGLAYAAGPNYNKTWGVFDKRDLKASMGKCYHLSRKAAEPEMNATPLERALIVALHSRFPTDSPDIDLQASEKAYANAMRKVYQEFGPEDLDVGALTADALMNSAPRKMFDVHTGKAIESSPVLEVKNILQRALAKPEADRHPGCPHLFIHLMEMSDTPAEALPAADTLRYQIPDAGHMFHMPTHLDTLVGAYERSIECNMKATIADDNFFARAGGVNFYSYYRLHNYHSLIYAAILSGKSKVALEACDRMEATITEDLLLVETPPLANWMEFFLAVRVHVLIRFGNWEELKALKMPQN